MGRSYSPYLKNHRAELEEILRHGVEVWEVQEKLSIAPRFAASGGRTIKVLSAWGGGLVSSSPGNISSNSFFNLFSGKRGGPDKRRCLHQARFQEALQDLPIEG